MWQDVGCESDEFFHRKENRFDLQNTLPEKLRKIKKDYSLKLPSKIKVKHLCYCLKNAKYAPKYIVIYLEKF